MSRDGVTTYERKISRAASTVASCSSSFEPNKANTPLLLSSSSVASRPRDSPSRPSTDATSTARCSTTLRVASPRATRPSTGTAGPPPGHSGLDPGAPLLGERGRRQHTVGEVQRGPDVLRWQLPVVRERDDVHL